MNSSIPPNPPSNRRIRIGGRVTPSVVTTTPPIQSHPRFAAQKRSNQKPPQKPLEVPGAESAKKPIPWQVFFREVG